MSCHLMSDWHAFSVVQSDYDQRKFVNVNVFTDNFKNLLLIIIQMLWKEEMG